MTRTVGLFVGHENDPLTQPERVFFKGTGALSKGTGVCYVPDYTTGNSGETATDAWGKRDKTVDVPSYSNAAYFAGVVARDYASNADGQWIDIWTPGSTCKVYVNGAVTIGDMVHCNVDGSDVGQFVKNAGGMYGLGAAIVEQTESTGDDYVQARLIDGGGPHGCVQNLLAADIADGGGAINCPAVGTTIIAEAKTITADLTFTLADGDFVGQRKAFKLDYALTTSSLVITVTTGMQGHFSGTTYDAALNTLTFAASGDIAMLEWCGDAWVLVHNNGATVA